VEGKVLQNIVNAIAADRRRWIDFMMRFELGLERPDPKRAPISAATIGGSYIVGGLIPLIPYMLAHSITAALQISCEIAARRSPAYFGDVGLPCTCIDLR